MFQTQEAIELNQKYQAGQRNFQDYQLRRADLRGLNLSQTDFRGVDLSYANLRDVNFSGADLREAYLNEADLTGANLSGANLEGASIIKTYLIKANCDQTNFKGVYLTGAYLTKSTFKEANFRGAYLNGAKLVGAELEEAYYDSQTRFDLAFNPQQARMRKIEDKKQTIDKSEEIEETEKAKIHQQITVKEFLEIFNHLTQISYRYLGKTMTKKYWESSRPLFEWLEQFEINSTGEVVFKGELETVLSSAKLEWSKAWLNAFIQSCSQIVQNYPQMLDFQLISLILSVNLPKNNSMLRQTSSLNVSTSTKENSLQLIKV
ncbi:pentapeptide repeat-containing protein [Crocosphaera sp. XPORK-15E]|uniref:pentapeptide repeat-containing protein n=1 Tax=Crocosphaera sp. XPORK-15E TaxID=3110247 RepID=UPI002B205C53|nr:pentapeptide repeat-containing protein [Crocosphaera sp. XPORK-15E]MEA5532913.1 pentapeptide repeat-containing protein [Crocosphaera sp. XPORK-15E]